MNQDIINKLNEQFTKQQVKSRRGPSGKRLEYIEAHAVIARLNHALESDWSFEIIEHQILEKEIVVVGKLTILSEPVVTKTAFGSQNIKRHQQSGEPLSIGDDLKAAASDALKKAATLLGVGLHLYNRDHQQPAKAHHGSDSSGGNGGNGRSRAAGNSNAASGGRNGGNGSNGGSEIVIRDPDAPLTLNQMKAIFRIGKHHGLRNGAIQKMVHEQFGKEAVDDLTKGEASDLISRLQQ